MMRKVWLVGALFFMFLLGMGIGEQLAQNRDHFFDGDSIEGGRAVGIRGSLAAGEEFGSFDRFWDDDIYMLLASLQGTRSSSNQQQGMRDSGRRGGGDPQRRRTWADIIDTDELLAFLKEHEPRMASLLEWQKENREERFKSQVAAYKEIYGPVMQQMKRDPDGGALSVKKIRLNFYITWTVSDMKRWGSSSDRYEGWMAKLKGYAADTFDVIILQQESQVKRMKGRIRERSESTQEQAVQGDRGRSDQRGGFDPEEFRKEIEKREKSIEAWKANKEEVVRERVVELLQDHPNFPWG
ncbi:MAG: hypothetical protein GY869_08185 [Planctomycetes bacterium]|nr:hypothetical protein [Planctomycetota bacterium]